ncbi:MSMEG_4193 family putative phosphomutase [Hoyosella rhizosphaerae]|uniref:Phosphoglycerate/bisphosphoglycerate mutase n=1 Tax=Hoyosella rhizosphaerae TaxID=1755582 RepID=A0A916X9Y8_9ACTN|nr:histidine phosphatase family protein [Hoyosella rhizosphaerae]MBN4926550.1 MSMEG_4193 family putative phosphomutase [Hoyosella rhizosphaerae]GGC58364.1 putative phosphoglycerate/bisphosphoglycerate mutase [Hoyosella rhizosphaerae]
MTVLLLRHGRSHANTAGVLAGRSADVSLDELGFAQAAALVNRFADIDIAHIVHSPLLRCAQTVSPLAQARNLTPVADPRLLEVDYGQWTGRPLKELVDEPLWKVVQQHPAAAMFPGGESLSAMQARAVLAVREFDAQLREQHGEDVLWIACSHGDIIKSVVADALGVHLDGFQRIVVEPGSVSVIRYTETRPFLYHLNDHGSTFPMLASKQRKDSGSDATVGGAVSE